MAVKLDPKVVRVSEREIQIVVGDYLLHVQKGRNGKCRVTVVKKSGDDIKILTSCPEDKLVEALAECDDTFAVLRASEFAGIVSQAKAIWPKLLAEKRYKEVFNSLSGSDIPPCISKILEDNEKLRRLFVPVARFFLYKGDVEKVQSLASKLGLVLNMDLWNEITRECFICDSIPREFCDPSNCPLVNDPSCVLGMLLRDIERVMIVECVNEPKIVIETPRARGVFKVNVSTLHREIADWMLLKYGYALIIDLRKKWDKRVWTEFLNKLLRGAERKKADELPDEDVDEDEMIRREAIEVLRTRRPTRSREMMMMNSELCYVENDTAFYPREHLVEIVSQRLGLRNLTVPKLTRVLRGYVRTTRIRIGGDRVPVYAYPYNDLYDKTFVEDGGDEE